MSDPINPSTPTLVQHGFTVVAAAEAAAATDSSSDSDNNAFAPAPGAVDAAALSRTPSATPPPPPPPSLGALGAALASADAEAEEGDETEDEEACDAFSSSSSGEEGGGKGNLFNFSVDVVGTRHRTPQVRALARSVVRGLRSNNAHARYPPTGPSPEGLGGSYVFHDEQGRPAAIVKPCDEEPLAPNNPKGFVGRELGDPGLRPTVRVGQAALREVAAFLLDHGGLAQVPPTVLVCVAHPVFHVARAKEKAETAGKGKGKTPQAPPPFSSSSVALHSAATAPPSLLSLSLGPPQQQSEQQEERQQRRWRKGEQKLQEQEQEEKPLAPKLASLQKYVRHDGDAADAGASRFSVRDVHAIGILDIRILNSDRHAGNLLVRRRSEEEEVAEIEGEEKKIAAATAPVLQKQQHPSTSLLARFDAAAARAARDGRPPLELVPIDHGFSLPDDGLEPLFLEWLHWPQSGVPFSQRELEYIARLDGDADAALLARELPGLTGDEKNGSCLRCLSVSTRLLQRCAAAGLTLADIGALCSRPLVGMEEEPSQLERVCWGARREVDALLRRRAKAKAAKAAKAKQEEREGQGSGQLISATVVADKGGELLLATTPPRPPLSVAAAPAPSSLGAVSTPALVSGGAAGIAARRRGGCEIEGDSSSSSPPAPPLSFLSSLDGDNNSGSSRSDSGSSLLPPLPLLPSLASHASTQSSGHPEDLLFELEGAAAAAASNGGLHQQQVQQQQQQQQRTNERVSGGGGGGAAAPASPLPPQQSLNPATGGAWSPLFRGSVLPGSSAESGSGGLLLASPSAGACGGAPRPSSSFGSLPPLSPRPLLASQQHSLSPTSPAGPRHLRGAPLGTSLALGAGFGGGGAGGGAHGGGGAAAEAEASAAAAASDNAAAAGFARRPATARERLRARALAALGGNGSTLRKKKSVCFTGDDDEGDSSEGESGGGGDDDCVPPPGASSARLFSGLEGDAWAAFVEAFDERVCAALRSGIWRNIAAAGGVVSAAKATAGKAAAAGGGGVGGCGGGGGGPALGVSCPRF